MPTPTRATSVRPQPTTPASLGDSSRWTSTPEKETSPSPTTRESAARPRWRSSAPEAAFKEDGVITAGSSSQISDGSAAIMLASKDAVKKYGLKPRAKITSMATAW